MMMYIDNFFFCGKRCNLNLFWKKKDQVLHFSQFLILKDKSSLQYFPVFLDEKGLMTGFFSKNALHFFERPPRFFQ